MRVFFDGCTNFASLLLIVPSLLNLVLSQDVYDVTKGSRELGGCDDDIRNIRAWTNEAIDMAEVAGQAVEDLAANRLEQCSNNAIAMSFFRISGINIVGSYVPSDVNHNLDFDLQNNLPLFKGVIELLPDF